MNKLIYFVLLVLFPFVFLGCERDGLASDIKNEIKKYEDELSKEYEDMPNFVFLPNLAGLYCQSGDLNRGRETFREVEDVRRIIYNRVSCYKKEINGVVFLLDEGHLIPNPEINTNSFSRMCNEMFIEYYEKYDVDISHQEYIKFLESGKPKELLKSNTPLEGLDDFEGIFQEAKMLCYPKS